VRTTYRVLAWLIVIGVVLQAATIAFAVFGLGAWVQQGHTLDRAGLEDHTADFTGSAGFALHGIAGEMVIPVLALALLVVAFLAKVPGGVRLAVVLVVLIALQVASAMLGDDAPALGLLHGLDAMAIAAVAGIAAARAGRARVATEPSAGSLV
jgi:Family of unknown function (DUF6220)